MGWRLATPVGLHVILIAMEMKIFFNTICFGISEVRFVDGAILLFYQPISR